MIKFISKSGIKGVIPTYEDIYKDIDSLIPYINLFKDLPEEYSFFSIPRGGNLIADRIKFNLPSNVIYAEKTKYLEVLDNLLENTKIILVDDIFCHGETILEILRSVKKKNIKNIIGFLILYHIPSREIVLINDGIFHLDIDSKKTHIYYLKHKFKLNIPLVCYKTYDLIVMPEDIHLIEYNTEFFDENNSLIKFENIEKKLDFKNLYGDC